MAASVCCTLRNKKIDFSVHYKLRPGLPICYILTLTFYQCFYLSVYLFCHCFLYVFCCRCCYCCCCSLSFLVIFLVIYTKKGSFALFYVSHILRYVSLAIVRSFFLYLLFYVDQKSCVIINLPKYWSNNWLISPFRFLLVSTRECVPSGLPWLVKIRMAFEPTKISDAFCLL